jgi:hypothetical protein
MSLLSKDHPLTAPLNAWLEALGEQEVAANELIRRPMSRRENYDDMCKDLRLATYTLLEAAVAYFGAPPPGPALAPATPKKAG